MSAAVDRQGGQADATIPRALHEALAARLMSGLTLDDAAQLRALLRAALADLRDIVAGGAADIPVADLLADSRSDAAERLAAAGIALDWPLGSASGQLERRAAASLRRVLRDMVDVALDARDGVVRVSTARSDGALTIAVELPVTGVA